MSEQQLPTSKLDADPFGLRKMDFTKRVPEPSEMFSPDEAKQYIEGCDFPETVDYLLPALRIKERFGALNNTVILDAMCGPGGLGRELLKLGARHVVFHDGDATMMNHVLNKASNVIQPGQEIHSITLPVDQIPVVNFFDLVVCQNSLHQLGSAWRLGEALERFVRATKPDGSIMVFDYQRADSPQLLEAWEERLTNTRKDIIPLLRPTIRAAFSKAEFEWVLNAIPGISWSIMDAKMPELTSEEQARVKADPVKGHVLDRGPISLEVVIQKEGI